MILRMQVDAWVSPHVNSKRDNMVLKLQAQVWQPPTQPSLSDDIMEDREGKQLQRDQPDNVAWLLAHRSPHWLCDELLRYLNPLKKICSPGRGATFSRNLMARHAHPMMLLICMNPANQRLVKWYSLKYLGRNIEGHCWWYRYRDPYAKIVHAWLFSETLPTPWHFLFIIYL